MQASEWCHFPPDFSTEGIKNFTVKLVIEILPMLLSYISTNYTPYHTKAKTSVYYFSYKRNFNSFYQPGIT